MLESNRDKVLVRIEQAQQAIQDRVTELRFAVSNDSREANDLRNAWSHLGILLGQFSSEGGSILWE